jgi:glycosyltransferase involved in cell wall biosynthesis
MKAIFVTRRVMPEGGVSLATFRLATVLREQGHETEVLYGEGEPPPELASIGRRLPPDTDGEISPARLSRALERGDPDLVLVGSGKLADLRAAALVAPTVLHAHMHNGVCADNSRYWARLRRPCGVRAGWHCALLRPALGCAGMGRSLDPTHVAAQRQILAHLTSGAGGVVCVSTDQAELFARHGVPPAKIAVLPNLGIRATAAKLAAVSRATPQGWRDATAFVGRLSKAKGGQLLGALAESLPADARLRVFGEGYMAARLASLPAGVLCGHVDQDSVMGVLMWARAAVFPSLWPEPGGIVGVDAQTIGVPLGAFDVGAARYWPAAERFSLGDISALAAWLGEREPRARPRDPEAVAFAQSGYWSRIAERGSAILSSYAREGRFEPLSGLPAEELIA